MNTFIKRLMSFNAVMRIITEGVKLQIWKRIQAHMLISVDFACSAVIYKVFVQSIQLQKPVAKNRYKVCYTGSLDKKIVLKMLQLYVCLRITGELDQTVPL